MSNRTLEVFDVGAGEQSGNRSCLLVALVFFLISLLFFKHGRYFSFIFKSVTSPDINK